MMTLEQAQYELLAKFVEAHRSVPQESRAAFLMFESMGEPQATFAHTRVQKIRFVGSRSDAEILADAGLLHLSYGSRGSVLFSVLPRGIQVYEQMKGLSSGVQSVTNEPRDFIAAAEFRNHHPVAYAKWEQAARLLWSADSAQQLTTIGHLCREAMQAFVASLATSQGVDVSQIEPAKTVARLKSVIEERTAGSTKRELLAALIAYWGTVSDMVQRQEHGGQREEEALVWEDARCVVFQTCLVMYEVSRAVG